MLPGSFQQLKNRPLFTLGKENGCFPFELKGGEGFAFFPGFHRAVEQVQITAQMVGKNRFSIDSD